MPELPELEICRRQLSRWGGGQRLQAVHIVDPTSIRTALSSRPSDADPDGPEKVRALVGRVAGEALRHGKRVAWPLGEHALMIHLGMTGKWVRRPASDPPPRHGRIGLQFGQDTLWMVDARRFGCVSVVPEDEMALALRGTMGPDALAEPLDGPALARRFPGRRAIKVALLDQSGIAGVGNIHAAESLWRANISPKKRCNALTPADWARLAAAIPAQLQWTVDAEDAEEIVYTSEAGAENPFHIYGHEGAPCPVCGTAIVKEVLGGRSTFWCPQCQPG